MTKNNTTNNSNTPPGEGLRRLITDILAATIPEKRLRQATAIAIDQTAFPTFFRTRDFRKQKDVDEAVAQALRETGKIPDDIELGPDGKLIRGADYDARAGHRSASAATNHKAVTFVGYQVGVAVLVRSASWSGQPDHCTLGPEIPPYIVGLSVDAASDDVGLIGQRLVSDVLNILPGLREVIADRGFTQNRKTFNRPLHRWGLDLVMDYKVKTAARTRALLVGTHQFGTHQWPQRLELCGGALFPTWMPPMFRNTKGLTKKYRNIRLENRARWRWSRVKRNADGSTQFRCPQCSGRIVTNLTTHNGRKPNKSAVSVQVPLTGECCNGLTTVPVKNLDLWQPIPWGTTAWKTSYSRRNQVESVNGTLRINGGFSYDSCRAKGLAAHIFAALALAVAYNLKLQRTDPLAATCDSDDDSDSDDGPDPAEGSSDSDLPAAAPSDGSSNTDTGSGPTLRAPP